ncbi:hypothetical protein TNCV_3501101 [Trichonephila clavipes]|nr:hypothetical protein TNCV_3501101 [Trichonephila clavipes]
MKPFLSALKTLLVGNLKIFILLIHDCSVAHFVALDTTVGQTGIETRNTTVWQTGIETRNTTVWQTGIETRNTTRDRLQTGIETQRGTGFKRESRPNGDRVALGHTGLQTGIETQRGTNRHLMQTWSQRGTLKTTWGGIKTGET